MVGCIVGGATVALYAALQGWYKTRMTSRMGGPWIARVSSASKSTDSGAWSAARNYYGANNGRPAVPTRPLGLEDAQLSDRTRAANTWRFMPL